MESRDANQTNLKKPGLGRGLDALFSSNTKSHSNIRKESEKNEDIPSDRKVVISIPIQNITPNKNQPRRKFDTEKLKELSDSIIANGLLQPILVQSVSDNSYKIIAGERRFRASQLAGLNEVQAIIVPVESERKLLELALLENIQRSDLSILEEARAYASLVEDFKCTHEVISKALSKSRPHITNCLRILKMPDFVLNLLEQGNITYGHAKVLAGTQEPSFWAQMIIEKGLTVRALESAIEQEKNGGHVPIMDEDDEEIAIRNKASNYKSEKQLSTSNFYLKDVNTVDEHLDAALDSFSSKFQNLAKTEIKQDVEGNLCILVKCKNRNSAIKILISSNISSLDESLDGNL